MCQIVCSDIRLEHNVQTNLLFSLHRYTKEELVGCRPEMSINMGRYSQFRKDNDWAALVLTYQRNRDMSKMISGQN